jgi:ABC-type nitrate/sulfonate/bicarbonate transport system permease component
VSAVQSVRTTQVRTTTNVRRLVVSAIILAVVWEVAAEIVAGSVERPDHVLPTIQSILGSFKGLSDYWPGGLGVKATQDGGPRTIVGAFLALGYGTLLTSLRLAVGFGLGVALGMGGGLLLGYSKMVRRFAMGPLHLIAGLQLLALLPIFVFWFGATTKCAVIFVAFGCCFTVMRLTVNAIDNVPVRYISFARTLGASKRQIHRRVILPAILPELRGGITLALTFAWSLILGGELIGVQNGLGAMMNQALTFSAIGRMVFIAGMFVLLAASSVIAFGKLCDRILRWAA